MQTEQIGNLAQDALALVLRQPATSLFQAVKQVLPPDSPQDLGAVISASKSLLRKVLPTQLREDTTRDPSPILIDRLSFSWAILANADSLIKKHSKQAGATVPTTESLRAVFDGILPVPCLSIAFLQSLCGLLELEESGGFLPRYLEFLKSKKPKKVGLQLVSSTGEPSVPNVRRLIWWVIRRRREKYIEAPKNESVRTQYEYLVKRVALDLKLWGGDAVGKIKTLPDMVETQVDRWLAYNCLDDQHAPADDSTRREIVGLFVKRNKLDQILVLSQSEGSPETTRELNELRKEITRYAEENRTLETRVRQLEGQIASQPKPEPTPKPTESERAGLGAIQELRDVLKLIDSKYAFDVLHGIQMGDESFLTMKNFLSHFFYALRKKGFVTYPEKDTFDLPYESSGLYECVGFEVAPGTTERVLVVRSGWALRYKEELFPVRKAQVKLTQ